MVFQQSRRRALCLTPPPVCPGWQELVGGVGRTYYWHEGRKQRQEALPEPLRKARALYDKDPGRDVPTLEKVDSIIDSLAGAKTVREITSTALLLRNVLKQIVEEVK